MELDPDSLRYFAPLLVSLAVLLFSATAESAIGLLSRGRYQRLVEQGLAHTEFLGDLLERPARYLATAIFLRILATFAASVYGTLFAFGLTPPGTNPTLGIAALLVGVLLLGYVLPRAVAASRPEAVVMALYLPLRGLTLLLNPLVVTLSALTSGLARLGNREVVFEGPVFTTEELRVTLAASEEEGLIEEDERDMIDGIFELEQTTAREIMVPRVDIVALPASAPVSQAIDLIVAEGCSRLPIYEESIDNVVGMLYAKDLLPLVRSGDLQKTVRELARPALFIPESKRIDELLHELQQNKVHIAIVVDEYGGTAGLVTIEDLLEEIVGEIQDEFDLEEAKIVANGNGEATFDATVSIDDVNETLEIDLHGEEVETIGGLVYENLGRVPQTGDQVLLDDAVVSVISTNGRRIKKVKVARRVLDDVGAANARA